LNTSTGLRSPWRRYHSPARPVRSMGNAAGRPSPPARLVEPMPSRLVAALALVAVFTAPISALWCAYACSLDDDSVPPDVTVTAVATSQSWDGGARPVSVSSHDDCEADVTGAARVAVVPHRAPSTRPLVVLAVALLTTSVASPLAGPAIPLTHLFGSPPGLCSFSVLRI
jgi:hypothetical protein